MVGAYFCKADSIRMGNYIVSARKYRPKDFDEVVGQDHITTTLKNAIEQDQLAQALLFCGPRGVGKTTCARIVANMINGFNTSNEGSSTAMNIYELDAASNNSVDDIRNLIDQVRYPPQYGKYKVYIIDEVHMLSASAFNAFLKTLEEPPSYAIFILATTEKHKVIPTILSRCQIFDFNRINITDMAERLTLIAKKENIRTEPEALHLIAQKADGALRDALSLFDLILTYSSDNVITYKDTAENLHILDYDYYFKLTDYFINEDLSGALLTFNEILKKGFDGQNFITGLAAHFRDLLVCKDKATLDLLEVSEGIKKKYLEQSKIATKSFLLSALNITNQSDLNFKSTNNQRLHVEITLMKLTHLNSALKIADIQAPGEDEKKKYPVDQSENKKEPEKPDSSQKLIKEEIPEPSETITHGDQVLTKSVKSTLPSESAKKTPQKRTIRIPSVKDLKMKSDDTAGKEEAPAHDENIARNRENLFNLEDLKKAWNQYSESLRSSERNNEFNLMTKVFDLDENFQITIMINNALEEDILERFKVNLTSYLRNTLENDQIRIKTMLKSEENSSNRKMYTNADKFNYLAEKNPNLIELKNKLGLDTEF